MMAADSNSNRNPLGEDFTMTRITRAAAAALADKTADAYSFDRYTSWTACAAMLLRRGHSAMEAEAILRSKWTRWAADVADKRHGRATAADLAAYMDKYESPKSLREIVVGTFPTGEAL
jgi:hypothetical protein